MDDTDPLAILDSMTEEELMAALTDWESRQRVLDQQMDLAGQMRERGPERSSPLGAALGGLSNAIGNAGGASLQQKRLKEMTANSGAMQQEALSRILRERNARQPAASKGLMPTMGDDELAALFGGGL